MNKSMAGRLRFATFLQQALPLHYAEVVKQCEVVLSHLDKKVSKNREIDETWFGLRLQGFLFFLTAGMFVPSRKDDATLYRPVIAALVEKGELPPKFLDLVDVAMADGGDKPLAEKQADTVAPVSSPTASPHVVD
jgi:hypothetical protein